MSAQEMRCCLALLHWSVAECAEALRVDASTLRRWLRANRIPAPVAAWLRALSGAVAQAYADHPPPCPPGPSRPGRPPGGRAFGDSGAS